MGREWRERGKGRRGIERGRGMQSDG